MIYSISMMIYNFILTYKSLFIFYFSWIFVHYISAQLYIHYCVPNNWYGIIVSPFLSMAPHCKAFRWVIHEAGTIFCTMWIAIGSWVIANILTNPKNNNIK